jgi:hypothetical protein
LNNLSKKMFGVARNALATAFRQATHLPEVLAGNNLPTPLADHLAAITKAAM